LTAFGAPFKPAGNEANRVNGKNVTAKFLPEDLVARKKILISQNEARKLLKTQGRVQKLTENEPGTNPKRS
jgi:translation elongation factor EF-4